MYSYQLLNCHVVDGSGAGPCRVNIAIDGDRITEIGDHNMCAETDIDMRGLMVAPGFVDVHRHEDQIMFNAPDCTVLLAQGITSAISGNCGFTPFPISPEKYADMRETLEPIVGAIPLGACWRSAGAFIRDACGCAMAVNHGTLAGNGTVRAFVSGNGSGRLLSAQMEAVKGILSDSLREGAFGVSLGIMFVPENYYATDELAKICTVAAGYNVPVSVHMRGEGHNLLASVREVIEIAKESGASFHISHFKAAGRANWGMWRGAHALITQANRDGLNITWDAYPYDAGSSKLNSLLPPWVLDGGPDQAVLHMTNPTDRVRIQEEMGREHETWDNLVLSTGWDSVIVSSSGDPSATGKSIQALAAEAAMSPLDCAMDLLVKDRCQTDIIYYHMDEADVRAILQMRDTIIISDSIYADAGLIHPRVYGTYARFLGRYVRDENLMDIGTAIHKCTGMPAARFGIKDRGLLRPGYFADVIAFDYEAIADKADYLAPRQLPEGMKYVFVNGALCMEDGNIIRQNAGRYLRRGE